MWKLAICSHIWWNQIFGHQDWLDWVKKTSFHPVLKFAAAVSGVITHIRICDLITGQSPLFVGSLLCWSSSCVIPSSERLIAFPVPGLHITSSQSILKITTTCPNPISNTSVLPWNQMPVSYPWHQLAVFTFFLPFCYFCSVWLIAQHLFYSQTLRIRSANLSSPSRALLNFPFLSERNSSGWNLCHRSPIEALDAVFICVFSRALPLSLPW